MARLRRAVLYPPRFHHNGCLVLFSRNTLRSRTYVTSVSSARHRSRRHVCHSVLLEELVSLAEEAQGRGADRRHFESRRHIHHCHVCHRRGSFPRWFLHGEWLALHRFIVLEIQDCQVYWYLSFMKFLFLSFSMTEDQMCLALFSYFAITFIECGCLQNLVPLNS